MIKWLREQNRLFLDWYDENWGWHSDPSPRDFIDWFEATGASPWVSVEERMPKVGQEIVALYGDPLATMFNGFHVAARTHCAADKLWLAYWFPLPPTPKQKDRSHD